MYKVWQIDQLPQKFQLFCASSTIFCPRFECVNLVNCSFYVLTLKPIKLIFFSTGFNFQWKQHSIPGLEHFRDCARSRRVRGGGHVEQQNPGNFRQSFSQSLQRQEARSQSQRSAHQWATASSQTVYLIFESYLRIEKKLLTG